MKNKRSTCKHGHEFSKNNTYINTKGCYVCLTCNRTYRRKWEYKNPGKERNRKREWAIDNKEKKNELQRCWAKNNPNKIWNSRLKLQYNIDMEKYESLYKVQNGRCAVCHTEVRFKDKATHVDHSHESGIVRGILCRMCNQAIGLVREDIKVLFNMIEYLNRDK